MENVSKIVVAKNSGKKIGYVLDVAVDFENLFKFGYIVVDEEIEGEFLLKQENILAISNNFVLIDDNSKLEFVSTKQASLIGKEVLDQGGAELGQVRKIVFKNEKCEKIVTNLCEIMPKFIDFVGDDIIFVNFKKRKKMQKKSPFAPLEKDFVVKVQSKGNSPAVPEKVRLSISYYLGKISAEDIFGFNNEKIVLKNELITKSVFEKAKKHNKLNQLFFAINRNV